MSFSQKLFNIDIYIDICSVGDYKLAVYPNYLLFGKAIFDSHLQQVKFSNNNSIKLTEPIFAPFFIFLQKSFKLFENNEQKVTLIYSEAPVTDDINLSNVKNCIFYSAEGENINRLIVITSTYSAKNVVYKLNYQAFSELCESFSSLFFKTYCYTPVQNTVIEHFVHLTSVSDIKKKTLKDFIQIIKHQNVLDLIPNETLQICNLIVRHRKMLALWRHFAVLNPRYQITMEKHASIQECKFHIMLFSMENYICSTYVKLDNSFSNNFVRNSFFITRGGRAAYP